MQIVQIVVGPLATNCYLVQPEDEPEALLLDPGAEPLTILETVEEQEAKVVGIICTHGHPDHTGALRRVVQATGAPVYIHPADRPMLLRTWPEFEVLQPPAEATTDLRECRDGEAITLGAKLLRVLHTPGHSPGSLCLVSEEYAFTGDTLFAGGAGRTDLPGGDEAALRASLQRLKRELSPITLIYPGHGEATVLTQELATNPCLVEPAGE